MAASLAGVGLLSSHLQWRADVEGMNCGHIKGRVRGAFYARQPDRPTQAKSPRAQFKGEGRGPSEQTGGPLSWLPDL